MGTALTMSRLQGLEQRCHNGGAVALQKAFSHIEKRRLLEGFRSFHQNSNMYTFVNSRAHAEDMLQRLHHIVDSFDVENDDLVESIIQGTLEEEVTAEK